MTQILEGVAGVSLGLLLLYTAWWYRGVLKAREAWWANVVMWRFDRDLADEVQLVETVVRVHEDLFVRSLVAMADDLVASRPVPERLVAAVAG